MFESILSLPLSNVLPFIKNKGEATALISAIAISQQLSRFVIGIGLRVADRVRVRVKVTKYL
jgi:hypothetical protein